MAASAGNGSFTAEPLVKKYSMTQTHCCGIVAEFIGRIFGQISHTAYPKGFKDMKLFGRPDLIRQRLSLKKNQKQTEKKKN